MTRIAICLFTIFLLAVPSARADDDRPIEVKQLPAKAQAFIAQHFSTDRVSYAKMERDLFDTKYEVIMVSGTKIEFGRSGEWKEVATRYAAVPDALVPRPIAQFVAERHPKAKIVKIERDKREWEVKLGDGMKLTFNSRFEFTGWDD